jgi:hypothetical protein
VRSTPYDVSCSSFTPRLIPLGFLVGVVDASLHENHAVVCKDPLWCSCYLENIQLACDSRNPWRPLNPLACLAAPRVPHLDTEHHCVPDLCVGSMGYAPTTRHLVSDLGRQTFLLLLAWYPCMKWCCRPLRLPRLSR